MDHQVAALPLDLYALARWIAYTATLVTIGGSVCVGLLGRFSEPGGRSNLALDAARETIWRLVLAAPIVLIGAHLLRLYGQARAFLEPAEPTTADGIHAIVAGTTWGRGWTIQIGSAILAAVLLGLARWRSRNNGTRISPEAILASLMVAFASPLTGHAMENPWGRLAGVSLHGLHLLGAGVWIGTLFVLFVAGFRGVREGGAFEGTALLARMVRAFSPLALTGAALVVGAGVVLGVAYVGSLEAFWGSTYGKTLLIKIVLLSATAALGAYHWKSLSPRLDSAQGASAFRGSAAIELTLAALILVATAVLVSLPAPTL
ncbi:MAG TPA: CopD family protein [Gemmatimonadales bacterium]